MNQVPNSIGNDTLEYVCVESPSFQGNHILSQYKNILPKEFGCLTETDADAMADEDMLRLLGDDAVVAELKEDCSLDNLHSEGEFRTLDEMLQLLPVRTQRHGRLRTLDALPHGPVKRLSSCHSNTLRFRYRRPQVDLSFLNTPDGCCGFEGTRTEPEAIFTVFVYRPVHTTVDCSTEPWRLQVDQRIEIMGSQSLHLLRDAIKCPQDKVWLGDCSEALDKSELHIPADLVYTSAYFFIENTFYDDLRHSNSSSLSQCLVEWQNKKIDSSRPTKFKSVSMNAMLGDLNLHLGKPYLFLHQGNCEHVIIFTDIRIADRTCSQVPSCYPICTGRSYTLVLRCEACKDLVTQWLVYDAGDLLPKSPTPLCDGCLRHLLYTEDGKKVRPNFRVHKYIGNELVR